jgi:formate dehydrogenase assembly factor FdhD
MVACPEAELNRIRRSTRLTHQAFLFRRAHAVGGAGIAHEGGRRILCIADLSRHHDD